MKITFLGIGSEQLGISQLSAIAKQQGHTCNLAYSAQLFDDRYNLQVPSVAKYFDDTDEAIKTIRETAPDVVAFGTLTSTYQWGLKVAAAAKSINPDIKVVFGGVHVSAVPDLVMRQPQVDYAVVGEGDVAFPEILKSIEAGDYNTPIINTRFRAPDGSIIRGKQGAFIQELDKLPFSDKRLWEDHIRIGDMYLIMATRGCPYRCTFCFNNFFANLPDDDGGKYVRLRSVDHVIAELKAAKRRYNLKRIAFEDDVFGTQRKWLIEFAEKYRKEINIPFQMLTHPRFMDDTTGRLLAQAGCDWIQLGIQSMDDDFKKESLLRYEKADDIDEALTVMNKYGINVRVDHMFGLPHEPISAQENALALYKRHRIARINTFWTCYLPGTQMMNEAVAEGRISPEEADRINNGKEFNFYRNINNVNERPLQQLYLGYEFLFKIMPLLPSGIKQKIQVKQVTWLPGWIKSTLSFIADVYNGLRYGLPVLIAYIKHYGFHLFAYFARKFSNRKMRACKVYEPDDRIEAMGSPVIEPESTQSAA